MTKQTLLDFKLATNEGGPVSLNPALVETVEEASPRQEGLSDGTSFISMKNGKKFWVYGSVLAIQERINAAT